jgi:hypothetical protein
MNNDKKTIETIVQNKRSIYIEISIFIKLVEHLKVNVITILIFFNF